MAEEVPIEEVLCNALEYLSKLGSNLRTRSENLKDRKVNRRKLKNSHAIKKAAKKVLLICDLSKKSLENVESGVNRVLSVVEASQSSLSVGAKKSSGSKHDEFLYQYFDHGSQKLRVLKTIPLDHYLSAKVFAEKMSTALMDKYPVFCHCKLFRLRNNQKTNSARNLCEANLTGHQDLKESDDGVVCNDDSFELREQRENEMPGTIDIVDIESSEDEATKGKKCTDDTFKRSDIQMTKNSIFDENEDNQDQNTKNTFGSTVNDVKIMSKEDSEVKNRSRKDSSSSTDLLVKSKFDDQVSNTRDESSNEKTSPKTCKNNSPHKHKEKPVIKCVSLSKLLKPEVAKKICSEAVFKARKLERQKKRETKIGILEHLKEEALYLETKRKEVNAFKPKTFSIIITKLPKLTEQFLQLNQLNKITHNDNVLCELKNITSSNKSKENIDTLDKCCLSSDSKTDKCGSKILTEEVKKVRDALLIESDSDSDVSVSKQKCTSRNKTNSENTPNNHDTESCIEEITSDVTVEKLHISTVKHTTEDEVLQQTKILDTENESINDNLFNNSPSNTEVINTNEKASQMKNLPHEGLNTPCVDEKETTTKNKPITNPKSLTEAEDMNSQKKNLSKDSSDEDPSTSDKEEKKRTTKNKSITNPNSPIQAEDINIKKRNILNDSSSDDHRTPDMDEKENITKNKSITNLNSLSTKADDMNIQKRNLLKDSSDEDAITQDKVEKERTTKNNSITNLNPNSLSEADDMNIKKINLLSYSSDEDPSTPDKDTLKQGAPGSKSKKIKESMHAKNMLLNHSSSEGEDDNLKNALNIIKKKLLNNASSSEDETVADSTEKSSNSKQRRINSDSSSSEGRKNIVRSKAASRKKMRMSSSSSSNGSKTTKKTKHSKMGRSKDKVGSSSSENQDGTDKEIEGLTNLNKLNKNKKRREQSSAKPSKKSTRSTMPKAPPLKNDDLLLAAESNSEAESGAESAVDEIDDDLPPIKLENLNGSGIGHLAKDDLLGESESSSSDDNEENTKNDKEDSSDEDNLKSRRRKANTISSDSEGGTKPKDPDVKLSDFEDSEDSIDQVKRKRKKRGSDSDASQSSTTEGKKKRRRIKQVNDSDASGSDSDNEGKNKHGRKNIRKVMGKNQLEEATKKAAREEKERLARIAERQKTYNNVDIDESGKPDEVVVDKVVLDFDPETKEPLIEVDKGLVKKLKPHQANGIKFMWNACFESVKRIKKDTGSGCILAHCMGLGKTLQVVSLTHTLLSNSDLTGVNRVLVVCPLSTVLNWVNEFRMWLKHAKSHKDLDVYELSRFKQNSERASQLQQWFDGGGVCVLGYEMFRNLSADNPKKFRKKMLKSFQESLVDPGPDLVVCDEGHLLKNEKTSLSQSMNRVKTLRRIVLTGTPLQNNLKEYYCMVAFVKPNLLGKYNEYLNRFVNPITNGQYTNSTEADIRVMKRRSHVLHKMLDGCVQRRDYSVLAPFLPPKHEYVLFLTLTEVQIKLYQFYLDHYAKRPMSGRSGFLFPDFQSLQRIWTHPLVLKYNSERYEIMQQKKRDKEEEEEDSEGSLVDFIDDDSTPEETSTEESSDDSGASDDSRKKTKKKKSNKKKSSTRRTTRANPVNQPEEEKPSSDIEEVKNENPTEWWIKMVTDDELEDIRHSHKLVILFDILKQCEIIGDKVLVFSQSLYSLDLIEHFLGKIDEATQEGRVDEKLGGHVGSWSPGIDYFRLDGSTSCENRSIWCKNFNREDNPRARLFLISTRAGGLGINLVAANRVVIFDVSWNPSHDVQSIFRVYRFGQKKPCYIYRFLAMGTMEEKIYERQVTKQAISKRVIDEQQIDRHYAESDLAELYKFDPQPPPRPVPSFPKDRLFAEMLKLHEAQIHKFHEHDSLLENKEEETLSEEERKAAWDDFEKEKDRPPQPAFPQWGMNGFNTALLAQQQQQYAYAAISAMLRKDMPNLTDDQIRSMLPLILNSNPTLMQKMNDIYKYAPPAAGVGGMMAPMMNPMMNQGGGTSGLQYEPPWQRQQQQQQQMRLQQLMQQQNQMNAKYYSGGLGSRDPVAMAMQQQRAREMMMDRGATHRGRGRPPLQPREPPTQAAQDVVDLDSD